MRLNGKTAVITGAATGIGRAIAELYASEGANIVIADIKGAAEAAAEMGGNTIGVETNVANADSTKAMAKAAVEKFGSVDILVNNAAIFTGLESTPMEDISVENWQSLMNVNVMGPWLCTTALLPTMRENGGGKVINIASVIAHVGIPFMLHYISSKGAVAAMTRAMAREFSLTNSNITVNAISPGYVHSANAMANTEQHTQFEEVAGQMRLIKRPQEPRDIAGTAMWLASTEGEYVNGQNIIVDGGIHFSQ